MKRTLLVMLGTALTVAGLLGSAWVWRYRAIQDATYYTDGDSIRTLARSAPVRDILWQPARALGQPVNSADDEYEPRLSGDGRSLFFVRGRPDEDADIYLSTRTPHGWTEPVPIDAVNTDADELGPAPSFDGSKLLFYSDRKGGFGGFDLWRISRQTDGSWGEPENLGPAVNTPFNDYGPALSPDGGTLYFASNRPRRGEPTLDLVDGWPATMRDDYLQGTYDIYASTVSADGFGPASPVDALNSPHNEGAPFVNPFASFLYFASDRPGGTGGFDLFRVRIRDGALEQPRRLGHAVNSPFNDLDPTLGLGGFELLFSSDRPIGGTGVAAKPADDDAAPDYNIFRTTSREVFTQVDATRAAMDWVGLWSAFWPVLLLLALFLLGLLLLRRLWTSERFQLAYYRLNLLAKCLLFSVLVHILLASVLAVWSVSTQIGDFLQPSSGTKVALISRTGEGLVAQIRGSLTTVEIETPEPTSQARLALEQLTIPRPDVVTITTPQMMIEEELSETPPSIADAASESPDVEPITPVEPSPADDVLSFDTPKPAEPDPVAEAQMALSPQDAGDVASRPATPNDAVVASAISTATGTATIDDARSAVRADAAPDAIPDRSQIQPGLMIAMPDPAMLEPETATPDESNAQQTAEAGLTVPSAPTRDVRSRSTAPADTPDVMTAILDAPPARPDTSADKTLATLDPGTVESRVDAPTPPRAKRDLAQLDVARAVAAEVTAPDDLFAVAVAETDLTVPTIATRPVQRDSTVPGVELNTATALLETERVQRERPTSATTMATVDLSRVESRVQAVTPGRPVENLALLAIPAPNPGRVAAPSESSANTISEATLRPDATIRELQYQASPDEIETATVMVETLAIRRDAPVEAATLAPFDPSVIESRVESMLPTIASTESGQLAIPPAIPGRLRSPSELPTSADTEAGVNLDAVVLAESPRGRAPLAPDVRDYVSRRVAIDPPAAVETAASAFPIERTPDAIAPGVSLPDVVALDEPGPTQVPLAVELSIPTDGAAHSEIAERTESAPSSAVLPIREPTVSHPPDPTGTADPPPPPIAIVDAIAGPDRTAPQGLTPMPEFEASTPIADAFSRPRPLAPKLAVESLALAIPTETKPRPNVFPQRAPENRRELVEEMGGSEETESAVSLALEWLAMNQSDDGRWSGRDFPHADDQGGKASFDFDSALTGLALMAFLGADHTHVEDGPYRETVERAIDWLIERQRPDGDMRLGETMYSQGIATIAMAEAYAMTADPRLAEPVRRATAFIESARNGDEGGWRYEPGQAGDSSVLGWQVMAMVSARRAGIDVSDQSFQAARHWLDLASTPGARGLYAYQPGMEPTMAMTAESMFVQRLLGTPRHARRMRQSADFIIEQLPDWDEDANTYAWYYATLALYQHGGDLWEIWNTALMPELVGNQRTDGRAAGSWDPADKWSRIGGRVYQTAICALTLEVYYRYLPSFVGDADEASGLITGVVLDDESGLPIPRASVRLDLPDAESLVAFAGPDGVFEIYAPELPSHVAVSASSPGYIPSSVNVPAAEIKDRVLEHEFRLAPIRDNVVAIEDDPEVHHLGNDDFTGSINSQFQTHAEGLIFERSFELSRFQVPPHVRRARIQMLTKGTQADNPIWINDHLLREPLTDSPRDGSFAEFTTRFPARWLREGRNTVRIQSVRGANDLDDFEFVNIRIRLDASSRIR